jgi:hypothetical protein
MDIFEEMFSRETYKICGHCARTWVEGHKCAAAEVRKMMTEEDLIDAVAQRIFDADGPMDDFNQMLLARLRPDVRARYRRMARNALETFRRYEKHVATP